jgi:hypothetical protein
MTATNKPALPEEDDLELIDGPSELAEPDQIPTVHNVDPVASYPDWTPANTKVVTCRIANDLYPGERFESREAALAAITERHGKPVEWNAVPGRMFIRVRRAVP